MRAEMQQLLQNPQREEIHATLGQGYLGSLVAMGSLDRTVVAISEEFFYLRGHTIEMSSDATIYQDLVVHLNAIDAVSLQEYINWRRRLMGLLMVLGGVLVGAMGLYQLQRNGSGVEFFMLGAAAVSCVVGVLVYLRATRKSLVFYFKGQQAAIPTRWYRPEEIQDFRRQLTQMARFTSQHHQRSL